LKSFPWEKFETKAIVSREGQLSQQRTEKKACVVSYGRRGIEEKKFRGSPRKDRKMEKSDVQDRKWLCPGKGEKQRSGTRKGGARGKNRGQKKKFVLVAKGGRPKMGRGQPL